MYIGNDLQIAHPSYKIIDDISSGFNGSATSFALQVSGETPVPFPISTQQVMLSVNGVVQEPDPSGSAGFKLLGSNIVFSSAPANGHAFFGVINAGADYVTAGSEFPDGSATAPSFTFQDDQDTGWFRSGSGAVNFSANGVNKVLFDGNGLTVTGTCTATAFSGNGANLTNVTANAAAAGTLTGGTLASGVTASSLTSVGTLTSLGISGNLTVDTSAFFVNASNNFIGIGTATPTDTAGAGHCVDIKGGSSGTALYLRTSGGDTGQIDFSSSTMTIRTRQATPILFNTNNSERARIDTSGRLVVGHTSSYDVYSASKSQIHSTDGEAALSICRWSNNASSPYLNIGKSRGAIGTATIVQDDDRLGQINFVGADGSDLATPAASIAVFVDGTPGSNDMPGRLIFSTTADGASSENERMRINSSGYIGINESNPASLLHITAGNNRAAIRLENTADTPDNVWELDPSVTGVSNTGFTLRDITNSRNALTIDGSGNSTFAGTVADRLGGDVRRAIQSTKTSAYTLVETDTGKHIHISTGGVTVPNSVFAAGAMVTIVNNSGSDQTITQGSGVTMYLPTDATTGNRTLAGRGVCTILFTSGSVAYISGAGLS